MKKLSTKHLILATIFLLSIVGGLIDIHATANGPWGYNDPVEYIATAHSLDAGQGLGYVQGHGRFSPIRIHPPFYSLVLAGFGLFDANLIVVSRWLNIIAFVACIFMAGWIFYRYSRAPAMGMISSALMLAFPQMLWMFSSAYSEPLFIFLILCGGLLLAAYLHKERTPLLIASAVVIGLVPATRYAGIAMVGAGTLTVLLCSSGKLGARIKKTLVFGLIASFPILVWLIWTYFSSAHSLGGRSLGLNWNGLALQFQTFRGLFIDTVGRWVPFQNNRLTLTYRWRFLLAGAGLALILALSIWAILKLRKKSGPEANPADLSSLSYFSLSAFFFVVVLLLTYLFTRPTIDVDNRMLLPFFVCGVMALFGAFALWQSAWSGTGSLAVLKSDGVKGWRSAIRQAGARRGWGLVFQALAWLVAAACLAWYIPQTKNMVTFYHKGDGLTAYRWGRAGIIQAVSALPDSQPVISNDWQLLLLWTGRPIYGVWVSFPKTRPIQSTPYGSISSDPAQAVFCSKGAALVVLNDFNSQFQALKGRRPDDDPADLFKGLKLYGTYADGKIYTCP